MSLNVFFQGVPWSIIINQRVDESDALILHHPQQIYIYMLYLLVKQPLPLTLVFMHSTKRPGCFMWISSPPFSPVSCCSSQGLQGRDLCHESDDCFAKRLGIVSFFQTKPVKNYGLMSNAIFLEAATTWNKTRHFECVVIGGFSSIFYGCCWSASGRPPTSFLSTGILPWTLGM